MKITLIQPYYQNIWEPLGLGYIISYAKRYYKENIQFKVIVEDFDTINTLLENAASSDIIGFSCTTPTYQRALGLATLIKKLSPNVHIIMGGFHPTIVRKKYDVIDQIVVGEGETAFLEILNGNREPIIYGKPIEFTNLPWPDRIAVKNYRHVDACEKMCGQRITSFQSRRGCPMNCKMCAERCMSGSSPVRFRDNKNLLNEIEVWSEILNLDSFKFNDPTWVYPIKAVEDFCWEKIKRGFTLPWSGMAHASFTNKKILELMKKANCSQLDIGVESGSDRILKDINKGTTVTRVKKVFEWCHEIGIKTRAFIMIGSPKETMKDINATIDLIYAIKPDILGVTILAPYPGSAYFDPLEHSNVDWSKVDEYSNNIWKTPNFTNKQLKNIQRNIYKLFPEIAIHKDRI